ncbi:MAG: hypothetical protein ACRENJ_02630 [Candidatus Eiseniibacteriota bacterium]
MSWTLLFNDTAREMVLRGFYIPWRLTYAVLPVANNPTLTVDRMRVYLLG